MRLVLDTNVVVSGVLTPVGPPGHLLDLVLSGDIELVAAAAILHEYRTVLLRPRFKLRADVVVQLVDTLEEVAVMVSPLPWRSPLRDASDEIFLAAAEAGAATLVTGNIADFPIQARCGVDVVVPRECLDRLR